jgi:isopentenyl-diphosphate delta-isomerase type 1
MKDNLDELFIVVDHKDKILEYRSRFDCHHDKTLTHRAIGVLLFNDNGELLLQKRSKYKDLNPGKYTISVGGHVLKGQTYKEAANREMQEELGIQTPIVFAKKFFVKNEQESEMAATFKGKYNGPFYPAKDEMEMVKFFKIEEIKTMQNEFTPVAWETLRQMKII